MRAQLHRPAGRTVLLSSMASDAHTWNLVYLQLVLEELGCRVINLGACVPDRLLLAECHRWPADLLVLSSVNGHGYRDGLRVIDKLRREFPQLPVVVGGKLGTAGPDPALADRLRLAGVTGVFQDGPSGVAAFTRFVRELPAGAAR